MQILTGLENDHCHQLDQAGAYEWWYADALDASGQWGVVMILFRGMPMSPDYLSSPEAMHGGYALSIYHRGVRIAFAFAGHPLSSCQFDKDRPDVSMPGASLRVDATRMVMSIDAPCGGDGRRASVQLEMAVQQKAGSASEKIHAVHSWVLASARSPATVQLRITEGHGIAVEQQFTAMSYHDHNMGSREMSVDFRDWYWGRFHGHSATYVFLATRRSSDAVEWFGRVNDDGRVEPFSHVTLQLRRHRFSMMGLSFHRQIELTGIDEQGMTVRATCFNRRVCEDGPFYQRYVSQWVVEGDGTGLGMSEYMDVRRLSKSWVRPFLRLPWMVSS